jgi:cell wall-associated NlpC family hydrolase
MTGTSTSTPGRVHLAVRRAIVTLATGASIALTPLPALANDPGGAPPVPPPASVVAPTAAAQVAVDTALAQVGDPYVWGAAGPSSFDCSGLTMYAWGAAGVSLPHSSSMQSTVGTAVSYSDLQPGDLVFFYSPISHVAMYIGNGLIVSAPHTGDVVKVIQLAYMPEYAGARRVA